MRKEQFAIGEFYHVYNRGVNKRSVVTEQYDSDRFLQSMILFNTLEPTGGIFENSFRKKSVTDKPTEIKPLVNIVCYCLNLNHFHFLLEEVNEGGISKYLKRLIGGYTRFFNEKYKRSGALFEGAFKVRHIENNEYLLRVSAYINANDKIHQLSDSVTKLVRSSFDEFVLPDFGSGICEKSIILDQFDSQAEYKDYVEALIPEMIAIKMDAKEAEDLWHD